MDGGVGGVDELAGNEAVGGLFGKLIGLGNGALHALRALGQHKLCAIGLHQLAALDAHGLRHNDNDAVAAGRCHGGKANAGVAGGGLDNHGAGLQQTLGLGVVDHGLGDTVFYAAGGVEVLQLAQNAGLQALLLFNVCQLQKRGFTDQLICGCEYFTHFYFPPDMKSMFFGLWFILFGFYCNRSTSTTSEGEQDLTHLLKPTFQVG